MQYLRMFLRGWWIMALTVVSAVTFTFLVSSRTPPTYQTSVKFAIVPDLSSIEDNYNIIRSLEALGSGSTIVATVAEVLNSSQLHREIWAALSPDPEEALETYAFSPVVLPGASALEVHVSGPNPDTLVLLANRLESRAKEKIAHTYSIYTLDTFDTAETPDSPISPNPKRDASLAAALAIVLGILLIVLHDQWLQHWKHGTPETISREENRTP